MLFIFLKRLQDLNMQSFLCLNYHCFRKYGTYFTGWNAADLVNL